MTTRAEALERRREPGRRQRVLLAALERAGNYAPVRVSDVGLDAAGGPMSLAEYSALHRAARGLDGRALHLTLDSGLDCLDRVSRRLYAWTCPGCSVAAAAQHEPLLPCLECGVPTMGRDLRGRVDCGSHRRALDPAYYPIAADRGRAMYVAVPPVLLIRPDGSIDIAPGLPLAGVDT